jgi:acetyl esterase/lipase
MAKPGGEKPKVSGVLRAANLAVRCRRKFLGPLRPTWDERFETWATVLHHYGVHSTLLPLSMQRRTAARWVRPRKDAGLEYEPVDAGGVRAEWVRPARCDESRVIFYLHGGGYCLGSIATHRDLVSRLCIAAHTRGLIIDYRRAPEHAFPAQLDDARASYAWLLAHGVDPSRLVVAGDSAGAGLCLSLLVALRDSRTPLPAAAVCMSPWVDLEVTGESMRENARFDYVSRDVLLKYARYFVPTGDLRNPLAAPLHADLSGLPQVLILAGGAETLLDDARRIADRAQSQGVPVTFEVEPDMIHVWPLFASGFPRCQRTVERIAAYVEAQAAKGEMQQSQTQLRRAEGSSG